MKSNIEVLNGLADEFSSLLGTTCKVHRTGKNHYCIGKCLDGGAIQPITQPYDTTTLHRVCSDILSNIRSLNKMKNPSDEVKAETS